jgi:hypothetical protein
MINAYLDANWNDWKIGDRFIDTEDVSLDCFPFLEKIKADLDEEKIFTATDVYDGYVLWSIGNPQREMTRKTNLYRVTN